MDFLRHLHRRSRRNRTYDVESGDEDCRQLEYDEVKANIKELQNDLTQLRKLLKTVKENRNGIGNVESHMRENVNSHLHSLNEKLFLTKKEENGLKQQLTEQEETLRQLRKQLNEQDSHLKYEKEKYKSLNKELQEKLEKLEKAHTEIKDRKTENAALTRKLTENEDKVGQLQHRIDEKEKEIQTMQEKLTTTIKEMKYESLMYERNPVDSSTNDPINNTTLDLMYLSDPKRPMRKAEKLNEMYDLMDLSDPKRPMRIAEKLNEMYDNDWTDCLEALEVLDVEEEESVKILLQFLTDSYEECGRIVTKLDCQIQKALFVPRYDEIGRTSENDESHLKEELPVEVMNSVKDLRGKVFEKNLEILQKNMPNFLKKQQNLTDEQMNVCKQFVADCIKCTWMMQTQNPPVYMRWDFPPETKIDTNILKTYTTAGNFVEFIVWPVVYIFKDGPVLRKGVVQPMSRK